MPASYSEPQPSDWETILNLHAWRYAQNARMERPSPVEGLAEEDQKRGRIGKRSDLTGELFTLSEGAWMNQLVAMPSARRRRQTRMPRTCRRWNGSSLLARTPRRAQKIKIL